MDITPELHLLISSGNDNLGWHDALSELIDNSFDAAATRCDLRFANRVLCVEDDGRGTDDISSMLRLGSHRRHKTTSLGTYGVGLKHAALWLGEGIEITTQHKGVVRTLRIDWKRDVQMADGKWTCPDPVAVTSQRDADGTAVTIFAWKKNRTAPEKSTLERIGYTFMPAINAGKQITVTLKGRKTPIRAYRVPAMVEGIEESFTVAGKGVSINIGIAQEGVKISRPGFCMCYGHRVIKSTPIGTGGYSASRMVGTITLDSKWVLTPHKNDLAELDDELEQEIYSRIEPLLIKASSLAENIESNLLRTELESGVNQAVRGANAKEKRPGESSHNGTVIPKITGRRRRKATVVDVTQAGSVDAQADSAPKRRGIKIDWCDMEAEQIGVCDSLSKTVSLNLSNQFIATAKAECNKPALHAVAIGLLCHHFANNDAKQPFAFEKRDFIGSWGTIMHELKFEGHGNGK